MTLCTHHHFDWNLFWIAITALASVALCFIAWFQLSKTREINEAEFIQDFKKDFYTARTRELLMLFEYDQIKFIENGSDRSKQKGLPQDMCLFEVTLPGYKRTDEIPNYFLNNNNLFSEFEIDDFLLGHYEDLGLFYIQKLMSLELIYQVFMPHLKLVLDNQEIKKYIEYQQKQYGNMDVYSNYRLIYGKIIEYEKLRKSENGSQKE